VIVDDLHVVYRVYGAGGDKGTAATALMRVVRRQRRPSVREIHAIRGVSFVVNHGDAIGIIGRNGSGKSTLLQAIAGLLPPERGCVYTIGQAALLGVNAALMDDLTGERNVVLGCLAMGMTPAEVKESYESVVEFSGVGNFVDYPMRTYSTGMAQRLRFSIAAARTRVSRPSASRSTTKSLLSSTIRPLIDRPLSVSTVQVTYWSAMALLG